MIGWLMTSFVEFSLYLIFYYIMHLLFSTIRINVYGYKFAKKPAFVLFWHGKMLPLIYIFKNKGIYVLISLSRDGEIASKIVRLFGFKTIRGSSSKGGLKGLSEMIKFYRKNNYIAITPDGPRGPKGKVDKNFIQFLFKNGKVFCVEIKGKGIRLNSWDSFFIPFPFTNVNIYIRELKDINSIYEKMGEL